MTDVLLVRNATAILTGLPGAAMRHDVATRGGDIRVRDGCIDAIGRLRPQPGERVLDASDCVVYPGWVNTHHHLFQSLLKGIPAGIDLPLIGWLAAVPVPYRRFFDREEVLRIAARIGLAELVLSGCTTIADHQYHYYDGMPFDASAAVFDEAEKLGVRLVLCRGGQTVVRSDTDQKTSPQLAPVTVDQFLTSIEHDVRRFHDPGPMPTRRVVSAPTTPTWSVQPDELKVFARAARQLGIRLHSHLSETVDYVRFCREVHHCTPVEFVERNEWLGPDVWYAHLVHLSEPEIARLGATGTGMAHCPQSNGRLGSGIAPVPQMLKAGAPVSLAVDGAASNEAADMLSEAHTCWMAHRAAQGAHAISVDDVVRIGTAGGAKVLGIDGVGTLAPGMAADLAIYALDEPRHFGLHDPAVAPVASGYAKVKAVLVGGRVVAQNGAIPGLDLAQLRADAQRCVDYMRANLPS